MLIAVIVASLFGIGWFSYEPLMQAINDKNKEIIQQDPVPEKPAEPVYQPVPEEFLEKETVAVTVPEEVLYSSIDFYSFIKYIILYILHFSWFFVLMCLGYLAIEQRGQHSQHIGLDQGVQ